MTRPILVHCHIPKTAGTTVRTAMEAALGERHRNAYTGVQGRAFTTQELSRVAQGPPPADGLSSHAIRDFPPSVDGRPPVYFCLLRDPLAQFLSYVSYVRRCAADLTASHRAVLPPDLDAMDDESVARWLLDSGPEVPFSGAFTVRFLTPGDEREDAARLESAAAKLDRMACIGWSEHVDRFLGRLEGECLSRGLRVRFPRGLRENTSGRGAIPGWIAEGTALRDRFEQRFWADRALLERVSGRLSPGP